MSNKINIGNEELLVLLEFDDDEYGKVIMCLNSKSQDVFVINNKIIVDDETINYINEKYCLNLPEEMKGKIF